MRSKGGEVRVIGEGEDEGEGQADGLALGSGLGVGVRAWAKLAGRVRTCESSSKRHTEVTAPVCCLRWTIISRVRVSQTLTSPSSPPETRNLRLLLHWIETQPPRWQLSTAHNSSPSSALWARILPSLHPLKMTCVAVGVVVVVMGGGGEGWW